MDKNNLIRYFIYFYFNAYSFIALTRSTDQSGKISEDAMIKLKIMSSTVVEQNLAQLLTGTHELKDFDVLGCFKKN